MVEAENKEKETVSEKEEKEDKKAKKSKLEAEVETLKAESAKWKNEFYKAYADMENLRKSLEKDHKESIKYRIEGFVENLLPILDSFQVALSGDVKDPMLKNYLVGFQYVYRQLIDVLTNEGVQECAPKVGDRFDENVMQATDTEEREDIKPNIVTKVVLNGYKLHEHLIRPAMVIVSKAKEEPKEESNEENTETNKA